MEDFPAPVGAGEGLNSAPSQAAVSPAPSPDEPTTSPPAESPKSSEPSESSGERHPGETYAEWLAAQPPEVVAAEHARLSKIGPYDSLHNRHVEARAKGLADRQLAEYRARQDQQSVMEHNYGWLQGLSAEEKANAAADDGQAREISGGHLDAAGFRRAQDEILRWASERTEAPLYLKTAERVVAQQLSGFKAYLAADPRWEGVAGKLDELMQVQATDPAGAWAEVISNLANAEVQRLLPSIRSEERQKAEATFESRRAEDINGEPEPDVVRAGIVGNGRHVGSLDDARALHVAGEITNDQMRRYQRQFEGS